MRVAIIGVKGYPIVYGGFDTFVRELAERLVKRGVDVTIYCHSALFKEKPRRVNGIDLVYMPAIESKSLSQITHSFFSFIHASAGKSDLLLVVNSANGPFGILPKVAGKPTVINVDGLEWERPKWKGFGAKYFYWASKMATRFYDQLVNDAEAMREVYLELFNRDSEVIAYGSTPEYSQRPEMIEQWGLKKDDYYVIVGRLIPDNNSDLIIEGFLKSHSQRKLVIVGDVTYKDEYASRIKKMSETEERLVFTGFVKDRQTLAELFLNSYCYFHGHEYGGTNPTILQALGSGCAILALGTVFNKEVLQDGRYGILFEKQQQAVTELVNRVEAEPETVTDLKSKAREGLGQRYDWEHITDRYIEVFENLLKSKGKT
ncbi:glycosyltransferase [Roseivirga misakiensis]|uniref:Glycosyl transferase n=1 Tax=Roseivirga misakiensis TaxID=1563681 RepID=A0A1E5T5Y0_9BACT|nr:glycosyltransferase [Roseivirga misakiensis]OEK06756.1 glycosyl transferase [Roseivirga misakiensis]